MCTPTLQYQDLLKSPHWEAKRVSILIRDEYHCRNCGGEQGLQVHHRQYHIDKHGLKVKPWDYADKYLVTLCAVCHNQGHALYRVPVFRKQ
jgi:5-methylcytosine-specific restriction endonuclease McrA